MTTATISPTVHVAAELIESHGVPSGACIPGLSAIFTTEISGDSQQLERLLILMGELACQAQILIDDPDRPRQEVCAGPLMLQCAIISTRSIADALGVPHE